MLSFEGEAWRVACKDALVGEILIESSDFPWLHGRFVVRLAFPDVEDLFDQQLALRENMDEDCEAWEAVYEQIAQSLQLIAPAARSASSCFTFRTTAPGSGGATSRSK